MPQFATLPAFALVMCGGAIGAGLRFAAGGWALANLGPDLPFATWGVNIVGGLAMGLLVGWLAGRTAVDAEPLRLLLGVGILGGFTTFSAFSLDVVEMILRGDLTLALAYAVSSVAGSVVALYAGLLVTRL